MSETFARMVVAALWILWLLVWVLSARNVKRARWREPLQSQIRHRVPILLAAFLFAAGGTLPAPLTARCLPHGAWIAALGTAMVAAGLGLAVWARMSLGPNWSAIVTLKDDHSLVRSGPYRWVRHPIYSGILLGWAGTAFVIGEWRGVLSFGLACAALVYKSRVEERRLLQAFPEYDAYRRETAALVPFVF